MKALIPAAGHGTRFLPVTRVVPKEMLPVGSKPAIQLIVEEALAAGADEVVIVTSPEKEIIKRYFDGDPDLAARIRWAYQTEQKGLGHAVLQAAEALAGETEPVLVLLGDALVSGEAPSAAMAAISRAHDGASVVGLERVPRERISRYGIVNAPSDLAIAGRYLLHPDIFALLASQTPGHGGEIQLTDSIRRLLAARPVYGYRYPGHRHDIGNPQGYLETLQAFA